MDDCPLVCCSRSKTAGSLPDEREDARAGNCGDAGGVLIITPSGNPAVWAGASQHWDAYMKVLHGMDGS